MERRSRPCSAASSASRAKWRRLSSARSTNGGIVMRPVTGEGQPAMKSARSAGAIPALPSSPATFTWTSTSRAGCCSSRSRADSEASEWISRTFGATSFTLRLWSCPMKSQVNRSPCASCLASSSCARFSPTSSMPASASAGRSSASTYLTAARISTSVPICSRTRSRLRMTSSGSIAHDDPRLAPRHAVVAAVGEVELRRAACAAVLVLHVRDARAGELSRDDGSQVEHAPDGRAVDVREGLEHLVADLVAAAADPRSHPGRGGRREPRDGLLDDASGERAPAAVQHRHLLAVRERDRKAVRHEDEQAYPGLAREVAVDPLEVLVARLGVCPIGRRPGPLLELCAVHLPAHRHALRLDARLSRRPAAVLAHAALARGEEHARVRQPHCACSCASSSAVSSSASRPDTRPSSLRLSVSSRARPTAGPGGTPAASRSVPEIS